MPTQPEKLSDILSACRISFLAVGIFSFLINLLMLVVPIYMLQIFDRVLAGHSYDTLIYLSIIAIGALFVMGLLSIARSRVLVRVSHWLDNKLSPLALERGVDEILLGGQYAAQSLRDISTIRGFLSGNSVLVLFDSPWAPVYLFVIFLLHPLLGIIATVGAIFLSVFAYLNEVVTRKPMGTANVLQIKNQQKIDKALNNAEAIQAMGMLPNIMRKWFDENETILKLQSKASDSSGTVVSLSKFIRMSIQISMLGTGAFLVIQNEITPGVMIAASIISARALAPIEMAIASWKHWKMTKAAFGRLRNYLERMMLRPVSIDLPTPKGNISVENVSYAPPGSKKPIIQGAAFQLKAGEVLGMIGPSGAGKSTLARLMLGIWLPSAGVVRLDGANVYEWERTHFGEQVGYLPQDIDLFSGTIRENIARMGEAEDKDIIAAAKLAGAHELILELPGGYEFDCGGFNLSGGQRQRIALARALYGKPCFIVLDEPNASLDNEGELALVNSIQSARERSITMVLISHRPNLLQCTDKIIVLAQGRIQLAGTRDEVMEKLQEQGVLAQQARAKKDGT